jgi:copper chaperone NosL
MSKWTALVLVALALFLAACQEPPAKPADIREQDSCARCRMPISDVRYAAELIDKAGAPHKFDEIGCLVNYIKLKHPKRDFRATFVMDYDKKQWLKSEDAVFVHSEQIRTPMSGGFVAFADKSRADTVASQFQGQVLKFDELFNVKDKNP